MILQRWQTVYLILAIAAMILFLCNTVLEVNMGPVVLRFVPTHIYTIGAASGKDPHVLNTIWLYALGWVSVGLAAAAVVTFRRLKLQRTLAFLSGLIGILIGLFVMAAGLIIYGTLSTTWWNWSAFLPFVSGLAGIIAYLAITRDKLIIESADRLWK